MDMNEIKQKLANCPQCGRHCPIDALGCPRGQSLVEKLLSGEVDPDDVASQRDAHDRGGHGHPHKNHRDMHGGREEGRGDLEGHAQRHGPRCDHSHGMPPMADDGSLESLFHQCMHRLRHGGRASAQNRVLRLLAEKGSIAQRDLQDSFGIQPGSLSELIGKLEGKGLIERERDDLDRRRSTLRITEAGRAETIDSAPREDFFSALTQEEQEQLRRLLQKALNAHQPLE